ncbi:MAG: PAS domain S-box protein [Dongiaceae bacterium]
MATPQDYFQQIAQLCREPMLLLEQAKDTPVSQARIISLNQAALEFWQISAQFLEGQKIISVLESNAALLDAAWNQLLASAGNRWQETVLLRTGLNKTAPVDFTIVPVAQTLQNAYYLAAFTPVQAAPGISPPGYFENIFAQSPAALFRIAMNAEGEFIYAGQNRAHELLIGISNTQRDGKKPADLYPSDQAADLVKKYQQCYRTKQAMTYEVTLDMPQGGRRSFRTLLQPALAADGQVLELVGASIDITDQKISDIELEEKIKEQRAIADLGQLALSQLELQPLLQRAADTIARALNVPFCKIEEYLSTEQILLLRAATGIDGHKIGNHAESIWESSQSSIALKTLQPVVVENIEQEKRFTSTALEAEHNIKSGVTLVISGLNGPYGVLSVQSSEARLYSKAAVQFLQSAADIIANAIKNVKAEIALRDSERLLSSILDSAQIGIGVSDESGRFVRVNQAFCRIYGYEPKELLGREFTILMPSTDHQLARDAYRNFLMDGLESPGEGIGIHRDGRPIDIHLTAGRLRRADGSMLRVTTVEDITERKQVESSLKLFQLAAINANDGILITEAGPIDGAGPRIVFANAAAAKITGYEIEEIVDQTLLMFEGEETNLDKVQDIRQQMKKRENSNFEIRYRRKEGGHFWAEVSLVPVNDMAGRHMSWLVILRDITGRKEFQQDLESSKDLAVQASRAKSDFLAEISHELRTPLNAIIGFADVLKRELFGPLGHERYLSYAEDIHESGKHLFDLVNNTLDLSRMEAGMLELNDAEVKIEPIIRHCLALVREAAQKGKVKLQVEIADKLPDLKGDETKLRQIILNMLSNAVKFTLPGGKVTITAAMKEKELAIAVIDTGVGIPAEEIDKVMQRYVRSSKTKQSDAQGTGLGIPVTKSLVELHGGRLELQSVEGEGTTITAIFPAERVIKPTAEIRRIA